MKWKLTRRFLGSVVTIVVIVGIVNTILLLCLLFVHFDTEEESAENFSRSFSQYVELIDDKPMVNEDGLEKLRNNNAWIQFLNDKGEQVSAYYTPQKLQTVYSPVEIVQMYKYKEIDAETTVFVGEAHDFSYFVGVKDRGIGRYVMSYNYVHILKYINIILLLFLTVDIIIALVIGLLFGKRLTTPLNTLIEGIQQLRERRFKKMSIPKGVYEDVFHNMNELSIKLDQYEKERDQLDQMREEWISNVSHDMKTPLASIHGYTELMKDNATELTPQELYEFTSIINRQSVYMKDLLDDLNLTMRLRNQRLPLQFEVVDIVGFIREMTIELLNDSQFGDKQVEFVANVDKATRKVDKKLLKRAIFNFIYNALVHNDENVVVKIQIDDIGPQSELHTKITIADNGRGIPDKDLEQVFERYYRGTNTASTHGTGLGMAIARDIILAHKGKLDLTSVENKGTTITILL
ncbi:MULTISPECIES: HAMP domain-containing sensor histidine kinase [Bacillaceae]|uniref:sensor histidine kinase n=1 Tax=Bacillaceae TaxID=186817 RepID=UPI000C33F6BA|nr:MULTISPECIES: HAMP domain-containing sensor histidine kinase [Bacillaceae]PKF86251.1 two-component sensor histidine kinase [Bacillus sp. BA3]CAH0300079.1 Alkaline phosphatase synthesis sensor protein PhoR [Peribacillus sp. Bi134]